MFARRLLTKAATSAAGARRGMAAHAAQGGESYPFGMHFHVSPVHKNLALAYGTMLWLWVFYRAKQDGAALLGFEHPWDHGHHAASHDESHPKVEFKGFNGRLTYERAEVGALPSPILAEVEEEETAHEDE